MKAIVVGSVLLYFGSLFSQSESLIINRDIVETLNIDSMYVTIKLKNCESFNCNKLNFSRVSELYLINQQKMDSLFVAVLPDNSSLRPQFPIFSAKDDLLFDSDCKLTILYGHLENLKKEKFLIGLSQFKIE